MAIAKADPNADIINGLVTVGGSTPATYDPAGSQHLASGDSLGFFRNVGGRYSSGEGWESPPLPVTSADRTSGSGAECSLLYPAPGVGRRHVLYGLTFGFAAAPSGGASVSVQSPSGTAVFGPVPVTAGGQSSLLFEEGLYMPANGEMRVVLSTGGAAVIGYLSINGRGMA